VAPSASAPPVAGYAYWFDASKLTGYNDGDSVSSWPNLGSVGGGATVPTVNSNVAPTYVANAGTGTGLPALEFASTPTSAASSPALQFPQDTNIRTVFSIFKGSSFLLTDIAPVPAGDNQYNFHRGGNDNNTIDNTPTAPLWNGPNWSNWSSSYVTGGTTAVNGVVANYSTTNMPVLASQNGYNLVALETTGPVLADSFNDDRGTIHSGDQSQAEVLIYDTPLTASQFAQTQTYLNTKWFGAVPNILPSASPVSISLGATLDLGGFNQRIASLSDNTPGSGGSVINSAASTPSVLTLSATGGSTTFSGAIQGGGALGAINLVMSGSGTQVLAGNNTFTGGATVNSGTLVFSGSNSYTGGTTVNGGILEAVMPASLPGYSASGSVTVNGAGVLAVQTGNGTTGWSSSQIDTLAAKTTWSSNTSALGLDTTQGSFTYGTSLTQPLTLNKLGPNTLTLTGANTNSGGATVSSGTLQLGDGTAGHDGSMAGNIVNNAALVYNLNGNQSYSGAISGSGGMTKAGPGTLTLAGVNSYAGPTLISAGTVKLVNTAPSSPILSDATLSVWLNAGNIDGSNNSTLNNGDSVTTWKNLATGLSAAVDFTGSGTYTTNSSVVKGAKSVSFDGAELLSTSSDLEGPISLFYIGGMSGGQNSRLLGSTSTNFLLGYWGGNMNSTYWNTGNYPGTAPADTNPHIWVGTLDAASSGAFSSYRVDRGAAEVNYENGTGGSGPGQLSLGGGNGGLAEYSKGDISEVLAYTGVLSDGDRAAIESYLTYEWFGTSRDLPGTTRVSISNGATLDLNGVNQQIGSLADSAPGSSGNVINSAAGSTSVLTLSPTGGSTTFSGSIQSGGALGAISLVMNGAGIQVLAGSNTYAGGTAVNSGVLTYLNKSAQPATGTTTVAAGATLGLGVGSGPNLYASTDLDKLFAGTMPNVSNDPKSNVGIDTSAGNFTYSSNIPAITKGINKLGSNTLIMTGSNSYTGTTIVSGGSLQFGDGTAGHDGIALTGNVTNNAALVYNLHGGQTYGGIISGNGGLTKTGAGTLVLTNFNSYGGATLISGGTLKLQSNVSTAAPPVPGYSYWFDASQLTGYNNGDKVSSWTNHGTVGGSANVYSAHIPPTYIANAGTGTGLPALQFTAAPGGYGDGTSGALQFPEDSNITTVFSIFKGSAFLLTDAATGTYNFHRYAGNDTDPTVPLWSGAGGGGWASTKILSGTTSVNGVVADYSQTNMPVIASQNGYNLVAVSTTGPVQADSFNSDRNTGHSGNQSQAEVLIYDTPLTDSQMQQVETYLDHKWFSILPGGTPVTLSNGGTLDMTGVSQTIGALSSTDGHGSKILLGGGLLTVGDSSSTVFDGSISGVGGSLIKQGTGMLVLSGSNTYTGSTTIDAGTLVATSNAALPAGTSLTVAAGGTFVFDPSVTGAPVAGSAASGAAAVPEPGTLVLLAATVLGAGVYRRFRRRSKASAM